MSFSSTSSGPASGSGSGSTSPSPIGDPGVSPGLGDPFDLGVLDWLGGEDLLAESGAGALLSTGSGNGLSDPYVDQGGWLLADPGINPYTGAPTLDTPSGPYVGADVDSYSNAPANDNPNAYAGGSTMEPYSGRQSDSSGVPAASPLLAFDIDGESAVVRVESVFDDKGNFLGYRYVSGDGSSVIEPFDRISQPANIMNFTDLDTVYIVVPASPPDSAPSPIATPPATPAATSASAPADASPGPRIQQATQRPAEAPIVAAAGQAPVQTLPETVIVGQMPYSPDVSHPDALARAQGAGRIEWGDLRQVAKGAYNGLVDLVPLAMGPVTGKIVQHYQLIPKAAIDPRYGGAAIMGEQFAQNLAFEAMGALPVAGRGLTRTLAEDKVIGQVIGDNAIHWMPMLPQEESVLGIASTGQSGIPLPTLDSGLAHTLREDRILVEHLGETPARWTDKPWYDYQVRATGTDAENVYRITRNGKVDYVYADALTNDFIVEAKQGDMKFLEAAAKDPTAVSSAFYDLMQRQQHVINQAKNYLLISDQLGYRGVRYVVSDAEGAKVLLERFTAEFPEAVASGTISVWWVP